MRIRPAVVEDARQIAQIHVLTWQSGYRGLLPQDLLDGLDAERRVPGWAERVGRAGWPGEGTLVADDSTNGAGEVLGFLHLCPTRDSDLDPAVVGEIASVYVRPDAWRRGVGRALMAEAVRTLGTAGYTQASLWVLAGNDRAIGFYTRTGWRPDGASKADNIGGQPVTELRYRHDLS